jgi:hypothetical protein
MHASKGSAPLQRSLFVGPLFNPRGALAHWPLPIILAHTVTKVHALLVAKLVPARGGRAACRNVALVLRR